MNALDLPTTLLLTQRVLGAGLLIQSAEVFVTRRIYERGGALGDGGITLLVLVRAGLALLLVIAPGKLAAANLTVALFLLMGSSVWLTVRTRGPLCGGSDSMFFQVQLGLLVASLGFLNPLLPKIGLGWIAAQSVLSYFLAGLAKLKNVGWRNGVTMRHLFTSAGPYVLFEAARAWGGGASGLCGDGVAGAGLRAVVPVGSDFADGSQVGSAWFGIVVSPRQCRFAWLKPLYLGMGGDVSSATLFSIATGAGRFFP